MTKPQIRVVLDDLLEAKIRKLAADNCRSLSSQIKLIIKDYFDTDEQLKKVTH